MVHFTMKEIEEERKEFEDYGLLASKHAQIRISL